MGAVYDIADLGLPYKDLGGGGGTLSRGSSNPPESSQNRMHESVPEEPSIPKDLPERVISIEGDDTYVSDVIRTSYVRRIFSRRALYQINRLKPFPVKDLLLKHCKKINDLWIHALEQFTELISSKIAPRLIRSVLSRVKKTRDQSLSTLKEAYASLHDELVSGIIKQSRNEFRKELLLRLGASSAEIFSKGAQKHLATLLVKTKEEYRRTQDSPEVLTLSSGTFVLPEGTRFVFRKKDMSVYVIEQPPQVRTVYVDGTDRNRRYNLALPFMVFIVSLKNDSLASLLVFFRNEPLKKSTDMLFCPALPNIHSSFECCFPHPHFKGHPKEVVEATMQNFWGSAFNSDYRRLYDAARSRFKQLSSLTQWEGESKKNPRFVLSLDWESAYMDVNEAVVRSIAALEKGKKKLKNISELERYVRELGVQIGEEIQEACFFLISHWGIDEKSLKQATEKLEKVVAESFRTIDESLREDIEAVFSKQSLDTLLKEAIQKAIADTKGKGKKSAEDVASRILSSMTTEVQLHKEENNVSGIH